MSKCPPIGPLPESFGWSPKTMPVDAAPIRGEFGAMWDGPPALLLSQPPPPTTTTSAAEGRPGPAPYEQKWGREYFGTLTAAISVPKHFKFKCVRSFSSTSHRRVSLSATFTTQPFFFIRVAGPPPKVKFSTSERASEPDCAFAHVEDGASEKKRTQCVPSDKGGAYATCKGCNEVTAIFPSFR